MDETRRVKEPARPLDPRSEFRRDRDRVLYSPHFARLAEITQVVSPDRGYVFHNRLTHSIKVAQIARTIAEKLAQQHAAACDALGGIDANAAEAAGLAHDLGHPPFGHIAEKELDRLVRLAGLPDGYEGNAQTFRIVSRLTVGDAWTIDDEAAVPVAGLNLTRSTLAGIIKYPWATGENAERPDKWGFYEEEREHFEWAREGTRPMQRTLTAEVMDWADDVTYALHDLLDFYRAGLIPLEIVRRSDDRPDSIERSWFLARMFEHKPKWLAHRADFEAALDGVLDAFPFDASHRYQASERDDQLLYRFATILISRYVNSITPVTTEPACVEIQKDARYQVDVLKEFVWAYVILNPEMAQLQNGQRRAVEAVFRDSLSAAQTRSVHFFPGSFRARLAECTEDRQRIRLAADYVAGMTERELMKAFRRIQGIAQD